MNRMLISATFADEVRVALMRDNFLYDLDIEQPGVEQKKANIYKGRVSRIEASLDAAFVEYSRSGRHGFLPFKEVARSYLKPEQANESFTKLTIRDLFKEGDEVLVQVEKDERGNKGAALTTFISLAGSYLVLMPNNPRVGGVSRRIEGKDREELRDLMRDLGIPEGMGVIVRTAGVGRSEEELKWDLDSLLNRWNLIKTAAETTAPPVLVYQEGGAVMRAVRDYLRRDIDEILVDNQELFNETKTYIEQAKPDLANRVKLYEGKIPLFSSFGVEKQIETAYYREVKLPSGGSISIDHTEALTSVDVNSAKATGGNDIEETALYTNLEAADELARQLRIRDIGGLIVIDFIDMMKIRNQQEVSNRLRTALEYDRARVQVGNITRFGLLEMSRQRLGSHLGETVQIRCPRCEGQGTIRSIESLSSSMLRLIEEESTQRETAEIQMQLPLEVATYILNERHQVIDDIMRRLNINILILPNPHLETPHYEIKRLSRAEKGEKINLSYKLTTIPELPLPQSRKVDLSKDKSKPLIATGAGLSQFPRTFWEKLIDVLKNFFSSHKQPSDRNEHNQNRTGNRTNRSNRAQYRNLTGNMNRRSRNNPRKRRSGTARSPEQSHGANKIAAPFTDAVEATRGLLPNEAAVSTSKGALDQFATTKQPTEKTIHQVSDQN